jgi:hypothetical protein
MHHQFGDRLVDVRAAVGDDAVDYQIFSDWKYYRRRFGQDSDSPQGIMTSWQSTGKTNFHKTLVDCPQSPFDAV